MVGFSYGGYVALTSSFQKPNQFKCIVSVAGISDINQVAANLSKYKNYRPFINKTMGNINDEETVEQLATLSAINKIKTPILLIHGKHDTRVKFSQSANFYNKAKQAGLEADYIEFERGTHFLVENENRLEAFRAMGEFLNTYL